MAITYTWTIPTVEHEVATGGITVIHYTVTGEDTDGNTNKMYGTVSCTPDPTSTDFIAYDNVTEANCIAWVKAQLDVANIEATIASNIDAVANPVTASGTPW